MKTREKLLLWIGAVVVALLAAVAVIGGLYWLTGEAGPDSARWWAVVATLTVPAVVALTWRVATHSAREHLAGFDRGLDGAERTIQSVGRGLSATASLARSTKSIARPMRDNDDLLPRVGTMRVIEALQDDGLVDL